MKLNSLLFTSEHERENDHDVAYVVHADQAEERKKQIFFFRCRCAKGALTIHYSVIFQCVVVVVVVGFVATFSEKIHQWTVLVVGSGQHHVF